MSKILSFLRVSTRPRSIVTIYQIRFFCPKLHSAAYLRNEWEDWWGGAKGNEWEPRPISAKTAPVSTNRAVNFGYRAILLFCQKHQLWWKKGWKCGWRQDFVFSTSINSPQLRYFLHSNIILKIQFSYPWLGKYTMCYNKINLTLRHSDTA